LLRKGDKRELEFRLHGRVGGDEVTLAHYTYTEISRDSEGNRSESDYHFTLAIATLPDACAARFQGVYLRPGGGLSFGGLQDKLAHDRGVQLESIAFNKRYDLRVMDAQDDIAVFELFKPHFIERLTSGSRCQWEQVGATLVVYEDDHISNTAELDALFAQAADIRQRYCEERV